MKKLLAIVLSLAMIMGLAACGGQNESTAASTTEAATTAPETTKAPETTEAPTTEPVDIFAKGEGVMTYEEYLKTAVMEPVVIEAFVQGKQSYYAEKGTANLYLADQDGAYYCYGCAMTQEQFDKLEEGTKVKVSGERAEYAGEIEVGSGKLEEIEEGTFVADTVDVTEFAGKEALADYMNRKVSFSALVVNAEVSKKASDSDPDIYFTAGGVSFCVESFLTGPDTDAYAAAAALKPGDVIDVEAFLYWYNGANPHVTNVAVVGNVNEKSEGAMSYAEFMAAAKMDPVVIEAFVQGKQAYYAAKGTANLYLADVDGAYYCYNCVMTQEQYDKLEAGTKVRISGEKGEYAGEIEVAEGKVEEILNGSFTTLPVDVTDAVGNDELLEAHMNQLIAAKGLVVMPKDGGEAVSKKENDTDPDLYIHLVGAQGALDVCVESFLTGPDTEVYKTAEGLKAGDVVDLEGFLYWYNGANPHVTGIKLTGSINEKSENVMSYTEFMATEQMEPVLIEAYVQGKQDYYAEKGTANLYLADLDGAYYCYGCAMSQEQFDKLEEGTKVRVSGEKAEYAGEIEVGSGKLEEILEGKYIAAPVEMDVFDEEQTVFAQYMNCKVVFHGMEIAAGKDGADAVTKKENDTDPDLYFRASCESGEVSFCVESYLTGPDSDVYKTVENLKAGDKVDITCFLYWYNGANPHVLSVVPAAE